MNLPVGKKECKQHIKHITDDIRFRCNNCHKKGDTKMKVCGGCKTIRYCSAECQKVHWKKHKPFCNKGKIKSSREKINLLYAFLSIPGKADKIFNEIESKCGQKKGLLVLRADKVITQENSEPLIPYGYFTYDNPDYEKFKECAPPGFLDLSIPGKDFTSLITDDGDPSNGIPSVCFWTVISRKKQDI